MKRPKWLTREVWGWAMFDFANQSFQLVILTAMFSVYFVEYIAAGGEGATEQAKAHGRTLWAVSGIVSLVIVMGISPLIGALADFSGAKKRLLFVTYVGAVAFTAALALVAPGQTAFGMTLFITGYVFFAAGVNFLGAFLPELADHRDMGKVSAFGWTISYIGGLVCLGGAALIAAIWPGATGYRLISLWAAVFFFAAGLPTFLWLHERKQAEPMPPGQTLATVGFARLAQTAREIGTYRHLAWYLAVMTFFLAGMSVVIWFAGNITKSLYGFTAGKTALFMLQVTVTAIVGAWVTGRYQDRIGTKATILAALALWAVVMLGAAFIESEAVFWILANGVGFAMGALGTSARAMVGLFSPEHKAAEFFGFYGIGTNIAAILGLTLTIAAEGLFSNYNMVLASSSVFFIVGFVLMLTVNEKSGRIAALRAQKTHERRLRAIGGTEPHISYALPSEHLRSAPAAASAPAQPSGPQQNAATPHESASAPSDGASASVVSMSSPQAALSAPAVSPTVSPVVSHAPQSPSSSPPAG